MVQTQTSAVQKMDALPSGIGQLSSTAKILPNTEAELFSKTKMVSRPPFSYLLLLCVVLICVYALEAPNTDFPRSIGNCYNPPDGCE